MSRADRATEDAMVDALEIRWTPHIEPPLDLLALTDEDILVEALREGEAYRLLSQQAIHRLHEVEAERDRDRARHSRLLDEYRTLRGRMAA